MDGSRAKWFFPSIYAVLAIFYTLPFLLRWSWWGVRDWTMFMCVAEIPALAITKFGQFPFWNPYFAGGNILFHHPEVAVLSPFFPLYLFFGIPAGLKIQVLICYFIGFLGSHRWLRQIGLSGWSAFVGSVAYFGSVYFALHLAEGHISFTHFCFTPWFIYYVTAAGQNRTVVWKAGIVLALMILGNGMGVPLAYTALFAVVYLGVRAIQDRSVVEFRNLLAATGAGICLSAVKFLPTVLHLARTEWSVYTEEVTPLKVIPHAFFGLTHSIFNLPVTGVVWGWHEYGAYVSPLLVIPAVAAVARLRMRVLSWVIVGLFFLVLGLGDFGSWAPWTLLHNLPGYGYFRAAGRAWQFTILAFAVLGGLGLDLVIKDWFRDKKLWQRVLTGGVLVLVVGTNMVFAWPIMSSAFTRPPQQIHWNPNFRHVINDSEMAYRNLLANRGSLISPQQATSQPSRALVGPDSTVYMDYVMYGKATVRKRQYKPNEITYVIEGIEPGRMVISMGMDEGWSEESGRTLYEETGLIAFDFERGVQEVKLRYRTPYFYPGGAISLLSLAGMIVLWRRSAGRGRRQRHR